VTVQSQTVPVVADHLLKLNRAIKIKAKTSGSETSTAGVSKPNACRTRPRDMIDVRPWWATAWS
jgi:hypothetical protein